jgi:ABC-type branched-subunit amino acid transport system substrate-binding protein
MVRVAAVAAALTLTGVAACARSDNNTSGGGNASNGTGGGGAASVKTGVGSTDSEIKVGLMTVQTGAASAIGLKITAGNELYFKKLNAAGGVAGKYKITPVAVDTKYDPPTGVQLYAQLKSQVAVIGQILGTPIVDPLKQQLSSDNILAQPATLDAFWVREPNLAPIGAPYQLQVINGLDYAVRKLDAKNKKVCAFTKDDPYGQTGLKGYDYAVPKLGLTTGTKATFKANDGDFTAQLSALKGADCAIIVLGALPTEAAAIMGAAASQQYAPTWIGLSPTYISTLSQSQLAPYLSKNFLLSAEGPNWGDTSVPGMKEQMDAIAQFAPDTVPDGYFTFGYNEAKAIHQILEQAVKEGDITQAGIVNASHSIEKLTFGGVFGDYKYGDPADREPPRANSIIKVDPTKPNGTDVLEYNTASQAAKDYNEF